MLDFKSVKTVGIFGDWHSNTPYATKLLRRIRANKGKSIIPDVFVHLGDFNFYPDSQGQRFLDSINEELGLLDRDMFVIDGNHEDFDYINSFEESDVYSGFKKVRDHIFYIPRGTGWTWGDKKFVGVGGAHSIDYNWRTLGIDFFLEEDITDLDVDKAVSNGKVDYLFTHESVVNTPSPFKINDQRTIMSTMSNKNHLRNIVEILQPKAMFHGHHHIFYIDKFQNSILSIGLNKDSSLFSENCVVLDIVNDKILFQFDKFGEIITI